jgi:hypothetical protein
MGEARHLAELHRLHAICAVREGRHDEAEEDLRRAITVASAQESRLFVLRAAAQASCLVLVPDQPESSQRGARAAPAADTRLSK